MNNEQKVILPTNAIAFKKLFSTPENKDVLMGLFNDFYEIGITNIKVDNSYNIEKDGEIKTEINGTFTGAFKAKFTLDVECLNHEYLKNKIVYQNLFKYSTGSILPTYSITVLSFNHFEDESAVHDFGMVNTESREELSKEFGTHIGCFEIEKHDDEISNNLKCWQKFFKTGQAEDKAPEYIKKASEVIKITNFTTEEIDFIKKL